jgi:hypothetical protein
MLKVGTCRLVIYLLAVATQIAKELNVSQLQEAVLQTGVWYDTTSSVGVNTPCGTARYTGAIVLSGPGQSGLWRPVTPGFYVIWAILTDHSAIADPVVLGVPRDNSGAITILNGDHPRGISDDGLSERRGCDARDHDKS